MFKFVQLHGTMKRFAVYIAYIGIIVLIWIHIILIIENKQCIIRIILLIVSDVKHAHLNIQHWHTEEQKNVLETLMLYNSFITECSM